MAGWANRPSAASRGYGPAHRALRQQWKPKVDAGAVDCSRHGNPEHPDCPGRIAPGTPWELGHDDEDRSRYTGPEHKACNQLAGRLKAARVRPREKRTAERHPGLL